MRHFKHDSRGNKLRRFQTWPWGIQFVGHFKHDFRGNNLWDISSIPLEDIICKTFEA